MSRAVILLFAFTGPAVAQETPPPPGLFPQDPSPSEVLPAPSAKPTREAGRPGGMESPGYAVDWYPTQKLTGRDGKLGFVRQSASAAAPVWKDGDDILLVTAGVRNSLFQTDALLPDTRRPFPRNLWAVNFGLTFVHKFDNGWTGILIGGVNSASDMPFNSIREINGTLGGMLNIPARNGRDVWTVGVIYSPAGALNFPIPIVGYGWNPTDRFTLNVGLPFGLTWRPTDDWNVSVNYTPLTNVTARVTYRVAEKLFAYAGYDNVTNAYFLSDRVNRTDRFFAFEQTVSTGVRWDLGDHVSFDCHAGYAFGRDYGEGRNQGSSLHDKVNVEPGPFVGASLRAKF